MLYTVTLNPTIDRTVVLDGKLIPGDVNRASLRRVTAGGKGINCAEAACGMGVNAAAYTIVGKDNIEEFEKSTLGVSCEIRAEMKKGLTRTCVKVMGGNGMVTEINEKGSRLVADEMRALVARIISDMQNEGKPEMILLSGSVPPGVESGAYAGMISLFNRLGIATLLDCDGEALEKGIAVSPYLVKPNLSEFEALCGKPLRDISEIAEHARALAKEHNTRLLVTIGADGMIYCDADCAYRVSVPALTVGTTVGAGDTVLGVLAASLSKGIGMEKALQLAGAAACAKVCGEPGEFPTQNQVLPFLSKVAVTAFDMQDKPTLCEMPADEEICEAEFPANTEEPETTEETTEISEK